MQGLGCRVKKIFLVSLTVLALALPLLAQDSRAPLRLVQTIPLSVDGRLDHLCADVKGMRLFVAALGNNSVEVIDLRAGKPIHSIGGVQKPRGVWYVGGLKKLRELSRPRSGPTKCRTKRLQITNPILTDWTDQLGHQV